MEPKRAPIGDFIKTYWPIALVAVSLAGSWAILGQRVTAVEERLDRQGTAITDIRAQLQETQEQYAALEAKVDGIKESVDYIRSRIDRALND